MNSVNIQNTSKRILKCEDETNDASSAEYLKPLHPPRNNRKPFLHTYGAWKPCVSKRPRCP